MASATPCGLVTMAAEGRPIGQAVLSERQVSLGHDVLEVTSSNCSGTTTDDKAETVQSMGGWPEIGMSDPLSTGNLLYVPEIAVRACVVDMVVFYRTPVRSVHIRLGIRPDNILHETAEELEGDDGPVHDFVERYAESLRKLQPCSDVAFCGKSGRV